MTVYILQAQGWGDLEDAFYNVGVYSTRERAESAERNLISEAHEDGMAEAVTNIEMLEMDM